MNKARIITAIVTLAAGYFLLAPRVNADAWDQLTKVTFSGPVEVPGQVLPAGTYWFKLLDSPSDRNIVQIYNADQSKQIALIMAIPDYRLKPTGKTVITFEERPADQPEAIKAWFYPGDNYGQEFVYPRSRAIQLAKIVKQPVLAMPQTLEPNTKQQVKAPTEAPVVALKKAPLKAEQPTGEEVEPSKVVTTPPQLLAQNTAPSKPPARLPATASMLPLMTLAAAILLAAGLSLWLFARRMGLRRRLH